MQIKPLVFTLLVFSPAFAFAKKQSFNCKNLSGTYECLGAKNSAGAMIELNGQEITYLHDTQIPLVYKADIKAGETSSEKQHVSYSSNCDKNSIEIKSTVTAIGEAGNVSQVRTRYKLNEQGDLLSESEVHSPTSFGVQNTTCTRVEAD
jgi:hypothetical protein